MDTWNKIKLFAARHMKIPGFTLIPNIFWNWYQGTKNEKYKTVLPRDPSYHQLRNFARNSILRVPIEHIEDTITRLPYKIEKVNPDDKMDYTEQIKIIQKIYESPNVVQSRVPFWKMQLEDLQVIGGSAFQKCPSDDKTRPLYLYGTDVSTIQFVVPYDYADPNSARYMQQQPTEMKYFSAKEVAYLQKNYFSDRPQGLSPTRAAYDYIVYMLNSLERADNVASNSTADFMIHFKNLQSTQIEDFRKYMQEEIEGTGVIPVTGGSESVETKQIRAINKDMFCMEWQEFLRVAVGLAWKYPPERLGIIKSGDRSTSEELDGQILENCVKPWAYVIEDCINEHIIKPLGLDGVLRFSFIYEDNETMKTKKSSRITNEFISGVIDRNTALEQLGYPKSDSAYSDLDIKEATAKMNMDMPANNGGFNGQGNVKDNYGNKPTDNKLKE